MTTTVKCPSCGAQTSGKFCSECGQPLAGRSCANCGASLSARAKFCPECGTTSVPGAAPGAVNAPAPGLAPTPTGALADKFPWIIAGLSLVALIVTIVIVVGRGSGQPAGAAPGGVGGQATTDISNMSPREAADRLFERTARAAAANDTAQVQFFGPMTIQAYANVTPLDADARLHMGLVQLDLNNPIGAVAQADSIARDSRTHLFAALLRARAASAEGNSAAARTAWQAFLRNWDAERAKNLTEYQQHLQLLDEARATAQSATGGS